MSVQGSQNFKEIVGKGKVKRGCHKQNKANVLGGKSEDFDAGACGQLRRKVMQNK